VVEPLKTWDLVRGFSLLQGSMDADFFSFLFLA
jgi:hypothetical protein